MKDLNKIIKRHQEEEALKNKGMSEEMLAQKRNTQKPENIIKIENIIKKISSNKVGQKINGR